MCFTKTCARSKKVSSIETTLTKVADSFLAKKFRRICNVPEWNWPGPNLNRTNPTTNEIYPTPIFSTKVTDHRNSSQVTQKVLFELQVGLHFFSPLQTDLVVES
jgi:hypothetical protein